MDTYVMVIRKGREPSAGLEALSSFSMFDNALEGSTVQDERRSRAVLERMKSGLSESLASEARLHGWRVQNLFEAMMVSLGSIRLIVTEDAGSFYFDDREGSVAPPDFRIIREDGEHLLVEVKNVSPNIHEKARINERQLDQERRYADLTGARLVLAHYWSAFNEWTVVDPRVLRRQSGYLELPITTALKANEIGLLGDVSIGTTPPLTFDLLPAPSKPRPLLRSGAITQEIKFEVGEVELSCAGRNLSDELEKRIAWFLVWYGRWESEEVPRFSDAGEFERLSFVSKPFIDGDDDPVKHQKFALVGSLSSMYSTFFTSQTMTSEGKFQRLRLEPDPGFLTALIPADYASRDLPIWRFKLQPNAAPE